MNLTQKDMQLKRLTESNGYRISKRSFWKDIEVKNNKYDILHNNAKKFLNLDSNEYKIDLSLTDEKEFAIANVIISK